MGKLNLTTRAQCKTKQNSTLQSLKKKSSFGQDWRLPIEVYGMEPFPLKSMGKTSNPDSSDSNRGILKFPTNSDAESEELSNDMLHDCVGTKDPSLNWKKSFSIEVYGKT